VPGRYWTPAEIDHAINVAQRLWCLLTLCLEKTVVYTLSTDGRAFYLISDQIDDFIVPLRVSHTGGARLKSDTIHNLDLRSSTWRVTPGPPTRYAQYGFDLLAITPQPTVASTLTITYAAEPVELVADADVPDIQPEQQVHLEQFAFWFARLKEGGAELQNAVANLNTFLDAATKYASFTRARSRAQLYDNIPFDVASFDRGRFEIKLKNQPRMEARKTSGT